MSITDQINHLWNHHYERALGCSHADPFAYADTQVAPLRVKLREIERRQAHPMGLPREGNRAGRRQAAEREAVRQARH